MDRGHRQLLHSFCRFELVHPAKIFRADLSWVRSNRINGKGRTRRQCKIVARFDAVETARICGKIAGVASCVRRRNGLHCLAVFCTLSGVDDIVRSTRFRRPVQVYLALVIMNAHAIDEPCIRQIDSLNHNVIETPVEISAVTEFECAGIVSNRPPKWHGRDDTFFQDAMLSRTGLPHHVGKGSSSVCASCYDGARLLGATASVQVMPETKSDIMVVGCIESRRHNTDVRIG